MELTKRERRLLNKRGNALLLWLGVLWVAMSIALPIYLAQKWKKTDVIYQTIVERAEGARADGTPTEARLKESLVHHARQLRELNRILHDQTTGKAFLLFFFMGVMFLGIYGRSRMYIRLIERLQVKQGRDPS